MTRKKTKTELDVAELKYKLHIDRRNDFNDKASAIKNDMEKLRDKKNKILDDLMELKEKKNAIHERIQNHKKRRDECHKRAKGLLQVKKSKRGKVTGDISRQLGDLDGRIKQMERKQETTSMSLKVEAELLDELRKEVKEKEGLVEILEEQKVVLKEVKNIDMSIDELFKAANEEHEEIVKLFPKAKKFNEKMSKEFKKVRAYLDQVEKKRLVFVEMRKKADYHHEKVMEMRDKILTMKK
ncbi:MAG: hypothetical protein KAI64_01085, partial [Thermoplasmata archaeon]|nr:hypothetical protein [Thermoplasmata archaeon]